MLAAKRRIEIVEFVERNGSCTTHELSKKFNVTLMTINRDLNKLSKEDKLKVVRGGAIAKGKKIIETNLSKRINEDIDSKRVIAKKAIEYIENGDSILLDSSTTSIILVRMLRNTEIENLTVVTNSVVIVNELMFYEKINVIGIGGALVRKFHCTIGSLAELLLSQLRVSKLLFSVGGLSLDGDLIDTDIQEVNLKKKMLEISKEKILMIESRKFNKIGLYKVANIEEVNLVISDGEKKGEAFIEEMRARGVKVKI